MKEVGFEVEKWYFNVFKDEGWGIMFKYGVVEGVKGVVEGVVMGFMGGVGGVIGICIGVGVVCVSVKEGGKFLVCCGVVKMVEFGGRVVVDYMVGFVGDVGVGVVLVEFDVVMGMCM